MSLPTGVFSETYGQDLAIVRTRTQWVLLLLFLAALAYFPQVASGYFVGIAVAIGIWVISALGLNITLGYCGQVSIAQSAFMAVGGYTTAILETKLGIPFWWTLPCAMVTAGLVGLFFGIPSLRVKGLYLVLATLAAQLVIMWVILRWQALTGGHNGIRVPSVELGALSFDGNRQYYYVVLVLAVLATYFTSSLVRSKVGRVFAAIRDNDLSAESLGINVFRYKLLAFFIGCAYAGLSGSLYVHYIGLADVDQFSLWQSVWLLGMVLIGGMGTVSGVIFGVIFVKGIEVLSHNTTGWLDAISPSLARGAGVGVPEVMFGLVVMLFIILDPYGVAHLWHKAKQYYRLWPFAYQEKS